MQFYLPQKRAGGPERGRLRAEEDERVFSVVERARRRCEMLAARGSVNGKQREDGLREEAQGPSTAVR